VTARSGASLAVAWLAGWAEAVRERREWLTDLDAAIGDGDHGINLDRGLTAVASDLGDGPGPEDTAGTILAAAGRRLLGLVGGASGALYGRALIQAGEAVGDDDDPAAIAEHALAAAVDAVTALGKAAARDKTMLDALVPALEALRGAGAHLSASERLAVAAAGAETGARATIPLVARKGRASYLGERSSGHLDPGAASAALLVRSLATAVDAP
jgi:dihydroxyacetone kinase-like protein